MISAPTLLARAELYYSCHALSEVGRNTSKITQRGECRYPNLSPQWDQKATQFVGVGKVISRALWYLSQTFGYEHLNEFKKKKHWSISWDGNAKFHKPALRQLFKEKNSTWKHSLAGRNKLKAAHS